MCLKADVQNASLRRINYRNNKNSDELKLSKNCHVWHGDKYLVTTQKVADA